MSPEPSLAHLLGRLQVVEERVRAAVHARRATDAVGDDRFRGLYITDEDVERLLGSATSGKARSASSADGLLARVEGRADVAERAGADLRLRRLARSFELSDLDVELLLVALAPDLDPRFEWLFAYLHDDVTRRRASTGLALELCADAMLDGPARRRFNPRSPLLGAGLLLVEEGDRPFLTRSLRVPDRIIAHVLGDDATDELIAPALTEYAEVDFGHVESLVRSLEHGVRLVYIRERTGAAGSSVAASALTRLGTQPLAIDLRRLETDRDSAELARAAVREARLRGAGLVAGPLDAIGKEPAAIGVLAEAPCPVLLFGSTAWDPAWSRELPLFVDAPRPTTEERCHLWLHALNGSGPLASDLVEATAPFRLAPEQIARAARGAHRLATARGRPLAVGDVQAAARAENTTGLERLARRIRPQAGWDDLVLPHDVRSQLAELAARLRHREQVLDSWGMGRGSSRGRGITCLFAGESGTGKTMAAEVVAGELALDLYVIDLSTVVDKYVGETEKNLDRVFAEAEGVNGVLLFDEADALFGKRSEVKDARDRWANVEVAYLLQRMELFDGMAILATNLRANVDEAFTRRLDAVVDFPVPDEKQRRLLWEKYIGSGAPLSSYVDVAFLSRSFKLSGGDIRNVVLGAAYLAASEGQAVGMSQIIRAVQREYRKLGRLCVEGEFGPYYSLVTPPAS